MMLFRHGKIAGLTISLSLSLLAFLPALRAGDEAKKFALTSPAFTEGGRPAGRAPLRFDPGRPFPRRSGAHSILRRARPYLPYGVGRYQKRRYESLGGPLYVNVGIGTYLYPVRFNCRPELTVIRL